MKGKDDKVVLEASITLLSPEFCRNVVVVFLLSFLYFLYLLNCDCWQINPFMTCVHRIFVVHTKYKHLLCSTIGEAANHYDWYTQGNKRALITMQQPCLD